MHKYFVTKFTANVNVFYGDKTMYYKQAFNYSKIRDTFGREEYSYFVSQNLCIGYLVPQE